jgi:predicted Ser/Thr protein kinase
MVTPKTNSNVQLLATLVDSNDEEESEYRFLVDEKHVKYVTVDPGVFPKNDRTFAPVLITMLPPFPPGDWNEGHISKDVFTGHPVFSRNTNRDLPGVKSIWHHTQIDHLELKKLDRVRQNIHQVTHSLFDRPVLVKFAEFPWQIPYFEAETTAYRWIDGKGIGPNFLGHVTEAGRLIGFVMENIDGARAAEPGDLTACQGILGKLHSLGIKHGDINRHNFLVRNGKVVLIDFETARRCSEREELESEYRRLEQSLYDPSCRGGLGNPVVSEYLSG